MRLYKDNKLSSSNQNLQSDVQSSIIERENCFIAENFFLIQI